MIESKDDEKVQCSERIQSTNDHIPYQLRMSLHHFPSYTLPLAQVRRPDNLRAKKIVSPRAKDTEQ